MKTLVVIAHPNPQSFNKNGILKTVLEELTAKKHEIVVRDLYEMNFNPVLSGADYAEFMQGQTPADIKTEQSHVAWAENIVLIYPIWWIGRPAMMQGYFDRVFAFNFAFTVDQNGARGLLKTKKGLIINTAGTNEAVYDAWPGSKQLVSRPATEGVLGYCGVADIKQKTFYGIAGSTDEYRAQVLEEVKMELATF